MNRRGFLGCLAALAVPIPKLVAISAIPALEAAPLAVAAAREDLMDMIWDISPLETPFISAIGGLATMHEWVME